MVNNYNWLVVEPYPSEKYDFVSWDDDIPNPWKHTIHVPNHQPVDLELVHFIIDSKRCWGTS